MGIESKGDQHKMVAAPLWTWIFLAIGFVILFSLLLWSFFGRIPITIAGQGILLPKTGLFSVQAHETGTVSQKMAKPGDFVEKGDLLMKLYDPQLELRYKKSQSLTEVLKQQLDDLKKEVQSEKTDYIKALKARESAISFNIDQLNEDIAFAERELEARKELVDKGLISPMRYHEAVQKITQKKIDLQNKIGELATVNSELKKEYRGEEIRNKELQLRTEMETLKSLEISLGLENIYSPYKGRILEILVNIGDLVQNGTPLIWLEKLSDEKEKNSEFIMYGYFQVELGKKIQAGMPVEIALSNINTHQYGLITGTVQEVSLYAISQEQLYSKIHNRSLINFLTNQASAVVQVMIKPDQDPLHADQLKWTSGLQPPTPITAGMVGTIEVTVERIRPFYYLIPIPAFKT